MLYLIAVVAAFIIGMAAVRSKKKSYASLELRFEKTWLVVLALILQMVYRILGVKGIIFPDVISMLVQAVAIVLIMLCFWFNRKYIGLWFIGAGAFMNALVMFANGGRMPVDLKVVQNAGLDWLGDALINGDDMKHVILNENSKLWFLSDIIHLPGVIGIGMNIVSIGDLFVALGLFVLVLEISILLPRAREIDKGA